MNRTLVTFAVALAIGWASAPVAAATACSPPSPFPAAPPAGAASATFASSSSYGDDDETFTALVWRQPCASDTKQSQAFVRITPTKGVPFICSSDFDLVEAGLQYRIRLVNSTSPSSSFCGDLHVPTTLLVTTWSSDASIDPNLAFTLHYDGYSSRASAGLPAYQGSSASVIPVTGLWWNPKESGSGYNLDYKNGVLVMTVFSYKPTGEAEWYLAVGPISGDTYTGTLYRYSGGQCLSCVQAVEPIEIDTGSTVTIVFASPSAGVMVLPGGRVTKIQPQVW